MVSLINNLAHAKEAVVTKGKELAGYIGKHKVAAEITAGSVLTVALATAAVVSAILTGGITAIICGAVLGSAVLLAGVGTGVKARFDYKKEAEEAAKAAKAANTWPNKIRRGIANTGAALIGAVAKSTTAIVNHMPSKGTVVRGLLAAVGAGTVAAAGTAALMAAAK